MNSDDIIKSFHLTGLHETKDKCFMKHQTRMRNEFYLSNLDN